MRILGPYTGLVADVAAFFGNAHPVTIYKAVGRKKLRCEKIGRDLTFYPEHIVEYITASKIRSLKRIPTTEERKQFETDALHRWQEFMRARRASAECKVQNAESPATLTALQTEIAQLKQRVIVLENSALSTLNSSLKKAAA